jgi:hypothetical protein
LTLLRNCSIVSFLRMGVQPNFSINGSHFIASSQLSCVLDSSGPNVHYSRTIRRKQIFTMQSQTSKSRSQQTAGDNATRTLKESAEREREKARVEGITSPRSSRSSVGIAGKHSLRLEGQNRGQRRLGSLSIVSLRRNANRQGHVLVIRWVGTFPTRM